MWKTQKHKNRYMKQEKKARIFGTIFISDKEICIDKNIFECKIIEKDSFTKILLVPPINDGKTQIAITIDTKLFYGTVFLKR